MIPQDDFDEEEWYSEWDEEEAEPFSCDDCGPWCPEWGGDGLCMIAIRQQAKEHEEYFEDYVTENVPCPVCGVELTQYEIPTDELWTWPGDFYNPMIALEIFAMYGAPKGEIHRQGGICHIWVGEGKYRRESLIKLALFDYEPPFDLYDAVPVPASDAKPDEEDLPF